MTPGAYPNSVSKASPRHTTFASQSQSHTASLVARARKTEPLLAVPQQLLGALLLGQVLYGAEDPLMSPNVPIRSRSDAQMLPHSSGHLHHDLQLLEGRGPEGGAHRGDSRAVLGDHHVCERVKGRSDSVPVHLQDRIELLGPRLGPQIEIAIPAPQPGQALGLSKLLFAPPAGRFSGFALGDVAP
jgi:hypothetical protein